ncbi:hypothetical protein SMD22_01395 (plasmid) [Brevibacillus halotolerans]|nr:hypothetical protein SMD22_01395 [Brevibacillus halotolerans]
MIKLNLFTVFCAGIIALFIYCLFSFIIGTISSVFYDPIGSALTFYRVIKEGYSIFSLIDWMLD